MVGAGLTGVIGTPSTGCCIIKIATGVQVVSLGYNQLPPSINVLNSVSLSYDTFVRTKGAVGWVVVDQSAYVPLVGGVSLTGQLSTNQTPSLSTHLVPKSYVDTFLPKSGGTMTGAIDMGLYGITTNQAFFATNSLVTRTYVENYLPLSGSVAMTGNLNMGANSVSTTQSSFTNSNLVTKTYVDNSTTFVKCPTADLGLRIVRGANLINGSTTVVNGNGFSTYYNTSGNRQIITWSPAFSNANYTFLSMSYGGISYMTSRTAGGFQIFWADWQNNGFPKWDVPFDFIAIGT